MGKNNKAYQYSNIVKLKRKARRSFLNMSKLLPKSLQMRLYRSLVSIPNNYPSEYTFEVARTKEDLIQASQLVYNNYSKLGFVNDNKFKLHVNKFLALPSTLVLVAKYNDEVVGTLSLIRDTEVGLPMEKIVSLKELRDQGHRLCEVSMLSVKRGFASNKFISFGLFGFLYKFALTNSGFDTLVINVNPKTEIYYKGLFLFKSIRKSHLNIDSYHNGAPALPMYAKIRNSTYLEDLKRIYGKKTQRKNIYNLVVNELENFKTSTFKWFFVRGANLGTNDFNELFLEKSNVLSKLSNKQKIELKRNLTCGSAVTVMPEVETNDHRPDTRYLVDCPVSININNKVYNGTIYNASASGCKIKFTGNTELEALAELPIQATAQLGSWVNAELQIKLVWQNSNGVAGFKVLNSNKIWNHFIHHIEHESSVTAVEEQSAA